MISDWIPAITVNALLLVLAWIFREWISTRLTHAVRFEYDQKLEKLRADFADSKARLEAQLTARQNDINQLRSGALTAMASRRMAFDKRQLEAIDQIWAAIAGWNPALVLTQSMLMLKFEAAAEEAVKSNKMREFAKAIGGKFQMDQIKVADAHRARPFLSPAAWALYSAYAAIIGNAIAKWTVLVHGVDAKLLHDDSTLFGIVRAILPEYSKYIDEHGTVGFPSLLPEILNKLIAELRAMALGADSDAQLVNNAGEVLKLAEKLQQQTEESADAPSPPAGG